MFAKFLSFTVFALLATTFVLETYAVRQRFVRTNCEGTCKFRCDVGKTEFIAVGRSNQCRYRRNCCKPLPTEGQLIGGEPYPSPVNFGPDHVNLGASPVNSGASRVNSGASRVNSGASRVNSGGSPVNAGANTPQRKNSGGKTRQRNLRNRSRRL